MIGAAIAARKALGRNPDRSDVRSANELRVEPTTKNMVPKGHDNAKTTDGRPGATPSPKTAATNHQPTIDTTPDRRTLPLREIKPRYGGTSDKQMKAEFLADVNMSIKKGSQFKFKDTSE